jgi:hypothetical protein
MGTTDSLAPLTPLRIGDSFEDLKRKMIPFAVKKTFKSISADGIAGGTCDISDANKETNILQMTLKSVAAANITPVHRTPIKRFSFDQISYSSIIGTPTLYSFSNIENVIKDDICIDINGNTSEYDEMQDEKMVNENNNHNDIRNVSNTESLVIQHSSSSLLENNSIISNDKSEISRILYINSEEEKRSLIENVRSSSYCKENLLNDLKEESLLISKPPLKFFNTVASYIVKKIIDDVITQNNDELKKT